MSDRERTLQAEFEIDSWEEVPYDEPDEGPKLTRVVIRKTYRGALEGTGVAEVLTAQGAEGARSARSSRAPARASSRGCPATPPRPATAC